MVTNKTYEYGIKYRVIKIAPEQFLLLPVSLEGGLSDGIEFSTGKEVIPIANTEKDLRRKYVVDNVRLTTELEDIYEYGDDTDRLASYFYDDYKNVVYVVNVKDNQLHKYAVDLSNFTLHEFDMTYHLDKDLPAITLDQKGLDEMLSCDNLNQVRVLLEKLKRFIKSSDETDKTNNASSDKVTSVEADKKTKNVPKLEVAAKSQFVPYGGMDVSFEGLSRYIKERIFGHDEEIDLFAQKMYMNYTAQEGEKVYSILFVGPTGTGKTETVRCAKEYMGLSYVEHNAANLVPQGIQGTSFEDLLITLYLLSNRDINKAQRGIIFLDEFDKLGLEAIDQKQNVKQIALTFFDGGSFHVRNDHYDFIFCPKMTIKICSGVFQDIMQSNHQAGFGAVFEPPKLGTEKEIRKKIVESKYYTVEELSRFPVIIGYKELTLDTKKQILLSGKDSDFAKKRERYKRQFGIELLASDGYIDAVIDYISNSEEGMRTVNNFVEGTIDFAEREILRSGGNKYKRLVLTKDTVENPRKFDLT